MTAAKLLREGMAARIAELRTIPADPVERARLRAERITELAGAQHGVITCWRCLADRDPADVRPDGFLFACKDDEDGCNERAAVNEDDAAELAECTAEGEL